MNKGATSDFKLEYLMRRTNLLRSSAYDVGIPKEVIIFWYKNATQTTAEITAKSA